MPTLEPIARELGGSHEADVSAIELISLHFGGRGQKVSWLLGAEVQTGALERRPRVELVLVDQKNSFANRGRETALHTKHRGRRGDAGNGHQHAPRKLWEAGSKLLQEAEAVDGLPIPVTVRMEGHHQRARDLLREQLDRGCVGRARRNCSLGINGAAKGLEQVSDSLSNPYIVGTNQHSNGWGDSARHAHYFGTSEKKVTSRCLPPIYGEQRWFLDSQRVCAQR